MGLGGNVTERPVTVGNSTGRAFTGLHGDGVISDSGYADVTNWPGSGATGSGVRGGAWNQPGIGLVHPTVTMKRNGSSRGYELEDGRQNLSMRGLVK
jgi:hypothetical protein